MVFQEVNSAKTYVKTTACKVGDVMVEGWYIGSYTSKKYGNQQHSFITETGENVVLNGAGQLDYIIENQIKPEDYVKVLFDGKKTIEKGALAGTAVNQFKSYVDPSRSGKRVAAPKEIGVNSDLTDDEDVIL